MLFVLRARVRTGTPLAPNFTAITTLTWHFPVAINRSGILDYDCRRSWFTFTVQSRSPELQ
ncbi:hypothetical protein [Nocardia thailandica]